MQNPQNSATSQNEALTSGQRNCQLIATWTWTLMNRIHLSSKKPRIMEGEKVGSRGIPSLLTASSSSSKSGVGQDEHIASDVTQLIGWTPLVELKIITSKDGIDACIIGKIEAYQPLCSVKDFCALGMIEDAEDRGLISPGVTMLVEPTGGNMGLGLVLIAIHKGYRFVAVMPGQCSLAKQMLLRYMGAELFLTDPALGFPGMHAKIEQLKKELPNVHVLDQFTNQANPEAHMRWTGMVTRSVRI